MVLAYNNKSKYKPSLRTLYGGKAVEYDGEEYEEEMLPEKTE